MGLGTWAKDSCNCGMCRIQVPGMPHTCTLVSLMISDLHFLLARYYDASRFASAAAPLYLRASAIKAQGKPTTLFTCNTFSLIPVHGHHV